MEDEESGMALNFQSTARGKKRNNSKLPAQDTLVKQPRRHRITARIGCVVMFLLIGGLIVHRIWAFQTRQPMDAAKKANVSQEPTTNGTENKSDLKSVMSHLRRFLCQPHHTGLADNATCTLCPENWLRHEDKCYWISKGKGSWKKGKEDCTERSSRLLVMQKQEDMEFIQKTVQEEYSVWIGLSFVFQTTSWTWIDGSSLNETMAQLSLSAAENTCGTLVKDKGINSEMCSDEFEWMCEKKAVVF